MIRGDLSNCLAHLTRGATQAEASQGFLSILRSKQLLGSSKDIRGGYKCVCFSEAPISVLAQALSLPPAHGMRYAPFGVMIRKEWLFAKGGRPVIYQPDAEFEQSHEEAKFRHVRYDPTNGRDYSWEREWRIKTDGLDLDFAQVTFVIPNRSWEERFLDEHAGAQLGLSMHFGNDIPLSIGRSPWHFIALEDLGLRFSAETQSEA